MLAGSSPRPVQDSRGELDDRRATTAALGVDGVGRSRVMSSSQTTGVARSDDRQFCDFPGRKAGSGRPAATQRCGGGLHERAACRGLVKGAKSGDSSFQRVNYPVNSNSFRRSAPSTLPAAAAEPERPPSAEATIPRTPGRPTAEEVESAVAKALEGDDLEDSAAEKRVLLRKLSRKTVARGSLQSADPQALPAEDCSPTSGKRSGFFGRGDRQHISRRRIV